jgi:hypothetical protein
VIRVDTPVEVLALVDAALVSSDSVVPVEIVVPGIVQASEEVAEEPEGAIVVDEVTVIEVDADGVCAEPDVVGSPVTVVVPAVDDRGTVVD